MIKIFQGDSSEIIILENNNGINILSDDWIANLIVVSSSDRLRPLIEKKFSKDIEMNVFFTMLMPEETVKLLPGKYVIGFQISNEKLCFRKEIKDNLRVKAQVVWDLDKNEYYGALPAFCEYTSDGRLPEGDKIILGDKNHVPRRF